ncbi:endonuclease/exonuclease/phosphatase family protein [Ideonella sp. BN130291]|uniref:endonuclease/exonuclease/phosphatase family protein n=1 Tax=Ideonella sp. BN130291 TaxID=3112940 RepID=UPI002E26AE4A|nr:endonuclease/exonuclease/phosphatase family protein [Ideonella sp. BN130291]
MSPRDFPRPGVQIPASTGEQADTDARFAFRVLTVNAHKGFGAFNRRFILRELREAVHAVQADVVFLQEVLGQHAGHAARYEEWPDAPQYEYLADTMWTDMAYGRNAVYPHGHHGNALLSRFPIVHHMNHDASHPGDETRGLLHCVLQPPGGVPPVHTVCVHLGLRESHRRRQLAQLCELVNNEIPADAPVVVAGDFNDWRLQGHRQLMECLNLREVFVSAHGEPARTFPSRLPMLRLDRIYARNASAHSPVTLPRKPWSHLSDHAPLAAEIHV